MKRLQIAVIGSGAMGRNHIRVLREMSDVDLVATVDPSPLALNSAGSLTVSYSDCSELIATRSVDAAIVAAPTEFHLSIGTQLLHAGIPTLIEKPLAISYQQSLQLVETSRSTGTPLLVGHVERYNPVVAAAKRCIDEGMLGDIASISARRVGLAPPAVQNGNNVILDMAVHDLDIIPWLFGRQPESIVARTGRAVGRSADDYADILMSFGSGSGFVQANWLTPVRIRTLTITGIEAYAELDYIAQTLRVYRHRAFSGTASFEDLRTLAGQIRANDIPVDRAEPLKRELQNFINVVRGLEEPLATSQVGAAAVLLAELAMSCGGHSQPVEIVPALHR